MDKPWTKAIKPYEYKPKYTQATLDKIKELLDKETAIEDIFPTIKKMHPDVSPISVYRWIEKVSRT